MFDSKSFPLYPLGQMLHEHILENQDSTLSSGFFGVKNTSLTSHTELQLAMVPSCFFFALRLEWSIGFSYF